MGTFNIQKSVNDLLNEFTYKIVEPAVESSIAEIAKDAAKKLRLKSPKRAGSGKYARGWKTKINHGRLNTSATIYNVNYRLPHLLEYGHVTRNGTGRTDLPDTPAHTHIEPVATDAEKEILIKIEKKVRG